MYFIMTLLFAGSQKVFCEGVHFFAGWHGAGAGWHGAGAGWHGAGWQGAGLQPIPSSQPYGQSRPEM